MKAITTSLFLLFAGQVYGQVDCNEYVNRPMVAPTTGTQHVRTTAMNKKGIITSNLILTFVDTRKGKDYYYMWTETYTNFRVEYQTGVRVYFTDGTVYFDPEAFINQEFDRSVGLFRAVGVLDVNDELLEQLYVKTIRGFELGNRVKRDTEQEGIKFKNSVQCLVG